MKSIDRKYIKKWIEEGGGSLVRWLHESPGTKGTCAVQFKATREQYEKIAYYLRGYIIQPDQPDYERVDAAKNTVVYLYSITVNKWPED